MTTSAIPLRKYIQAWPMASLPEAQAEPIEKAGPRAPRSIARWPAAPLDMIIGMVNGLTRRGPSCSMIPTESSSARSPPMADETMTATRPALASVISKPDLARASAARGAGQDLEPVAAPHLACLDVRCRIETLHLAGDVHAQIGRHRPA